MNIIENKTVEKQLPPLIKQSATYKLIVPRKVEEKIRYLCRKFPTLEWSGVLFTTHEGNFEDGNLVITCQDIYPMDLGSPGFTQFKMDETVSAYIAENIELFDCDVQLIHSHNQMSCFFSGQDQATLREEGNDRNCFVSLIVNNAGTYCAAVTRKLQLTKKVTVETSGISYEFFGEGKKALTSSASPVENVSEETAIQYFMLDVEVEKVENPLDYLDTRFDEIEAKKKAAVPPKVNQKTEKLPYLANPVNEDFFDWIHKDKPAAESPKQASLWDKDEMDEMIDVSGWNPDPTIIHHLCCQMVTSSLIVSFDIDLKQWIVRYMDKKYKEIFEDMEEFERWADSMIEFILNHYNDPDVPAQLYDDWDYYMAKVAGAIINELSEYPSNEYIDEYIAQLTKRGYE
jgi:hypothetical protein